jgi:hypothetical protein
MALGVSLEASITSFSESVSILFICSYISIRSLTKLPCLMTPPRLSRIAPMKNATETIKSLSQDS